MGGSLLGKTNTPHFGHKFSSDNLYLPPGRNPWKLDRTWAARPGGAGCRRAAGPWTDRAGVGRRRVDPVPGALVRLFGLKTTSGLGARFPTTDFWGNSVVGPIARTVRDAALLLQVLAARTARSAVAAHAVRGLSCRLRGRSLGACGSFTAPISATRPSGSRGPRDHHGGGPSVRRFGCTFEERDPSWFDPSPFHKVAAMVGAHARFADRAAEHPEWIEPSLLEQIVAGSTYSTMTTSRRATIGDGSTPRCGVFETCDLL